MMTFAADYLWAIAKEWSTWLGAIIGFVGLVEFYWKPLLPLVTPKAKIGLAVVLVFISQASVYKSLYDRMGSNRGIIDRISQFIDQGVQVKLGNRAKSPQVHDYTDPGPAVAWERSVCEYLTTARDASLCIRFKNRLAPLVNPADQRRDTLDSAIDARMERLEQLQLELARP